MLVYTTKYLNIKTSAFMYYADEYAGLLRTFANYPAALLLRNC